MKNIPIYVCDIAVFVGCPSKECTRISSFHNVLYYNNYFRKCFKLVYRENVVWVTLITGVISLLSSACTFGCGEFYEGVRVCADRL
jgi:hypothetical protein